MKKDDHSRTAATLIDLSDSGTLTHDTNYYYHHTLYHHVVCRHNLSPPHYPRLPRLTPTLPYYIAMTPSPWLGFRCNL